MQEFEAALAGRKVLVTGHTGFTGGWLSLWLHRIGCSVAGLALEPTTTPALFHEARIGELVESHIGDIRDQDTVRRAVEATEPEVVFHLAAQPLVSRSYDDPVESYAVNALGTAHVLEAARLSPHVKGVVCITTDKVYDDQDWDWGYRETDRLGGKDPYSASKACAELIASSYRRTMVQRGNGMLISVARGGNIIGGGDWADNRIVPDFMRAVVAGQPLTLRHPEAVRPWQHVLALVHGYLLLASGLLKGDSALADSWNFGPTDTSVKTVADLLECLARHGRRPDLRYTAGVFPETRFLHVDSARARQRLNWSPPLDFEATCALTAAWYEGYGQNPAAARQLTLDQIEHYRRALG